MVAAPIYATLADYRDYFDDQGLTVTVPLLRQASRIVDEMLFGAVYQVDSNEVATDATIAVAITSATCAQAQWMDAAGDTTGAGDVQVVDSAAIGSVSFSGSRTIAAAGVTTSGAQVSPAAHRELQGAGLRAVVFTHG